MKNLFPNFQVRLQKPFATNKKQVLYGEQRLQRWRIFWRSPAPFVFAFLLCVSGLANSKTTNDWILHSTVDGVEFYYQFSSCNSESVVFLKVVNKNPSNVMVSWKEELWVENLHIKENPMGIKSLELPGEGTVNGLCGDTEVPECSSPAHKVVSFPGAVFSKFNLLDINVQAL